jgi:hypothetical protein
MQQAWGRKTLRTIGLRAEGTQPTDYGAPVGGATLDILKAYIENQGR